MLLVLLAAAAFFRFYNLTYESLWLDEIYSMRGSDPNTSLSDVYEYSKHDQPPLFFLMLYGWLEIFGSTDFSGRALTCIYGIAAIPVMYFLGKEIKNERVGLFAAFLTSINWFHIDVSKEIRFYSLVFLLTALSFLFFLKAIKYEKPRFYVAYAVFTGLLLNTHYYGQVVFLSQAVLFLVILVRFKRELKFVLSSILSGALAGLMILHWLPVIFSDLQISSFHVEQVKATFPFEFAWAYFREPVAFAVFVVSAFFLIIKLRQGGLEKLRVDHLVIFFWLVLSFLIPLIYSWIKIPLLTFKYSIIALPAVLLIFAYAFSSISSGKVRTYALLAVVISGMILLFFARPPFKHRRAEDWRDVATYFSRNKSGDQLIFSQLAWFHEYYFRKYDCPVPLDQNVVDFSSLSLDVDSIWLLLNNRYTGGWPTSGFLPPQKEVVDNNFAPADSVIFRQTTAILYRRKDAIELKETTSER